MKKISSALIARMLVPALLVVVTMGAPGLFGQGLNWEGQTGAFITPLAYTSKSPAKGLGTPQLSFHYLDGGSVIGGLTQSSVTLGFRRTWKSAIRGPPRWAVRRLV